MDPRPYILSCHTDRWYLGRGTRSEAEEKCGPAGSRTIVEMIVLTNADDSTANARRVGRILAGVH